MPTIAYFPYHHVLVASDLDRDVHDHVATLIASYDIYCTAPVTVSHVEDTTGKVSGIMDIEGVLADILGESKEVRSGITYRGTAWSFLEHVSPKLKEVVLCDGLSVNLPETFRENFTAGWSHHTLERAVRAYREYADSVPPDALARAISFVLNVPTSRIVIQSKQKEE